MFLVRGTGHGIGAKTDSNARERPGAAMPGGSRRRVGDPLLARRVPHDRPVSGIAGPGSGRIPLPIAQLGRDFPPAPGRAEWYGR